MITDIHNRPLRDLRISVTDRCNFRCVYCMPREIYHKNFNYLQHTDLLTFEEIARLAKIFVAFGVRKIRLTGGEPLMRKNLETLIEMLAQAGAVDIALTTNGSFPVSRIQSLKDAGLTRMTVSLDSLDDTIFKQLNDVNFSVDRVLNWISNAANAGFSPVKINMVVKKGMNEESILPIIAHFRGKGHIIRFIEFMDVGTTNGWLKNDVVTAKEMLARVEKEYSIEPLEENYPGEVARRYRLKDGSAEFGIIASVTQPFCGDCTRLRLSANGSLYTCLFSNLGHDIRKVVRETKSDDALRDFILKLWKNRNDRYSELRKNNAQHTDKVEMSFIGG